MGKTAALVLYNLKKEKSSFISFGLIILITALILNCAAVLLRQTGKAYDRRLEELSTAAINAIIPASRFNSEIEKVLDEIENVEKTEIHTAIMTEAAVKDFNGADFSMNTVFYSIDDRRSLNRFEIVSESERVLDDPIYIPLYISVFGGFALGDEIVYVIDGKAHSFAVAGIIEEMQYGNYGSGLLCAYLPEKEFAELADLYSGKAVVEYSMSVRSDAGLDRVKDDVSKVIESNGAMALTILDSESVKGTRTMLAELLVLILAAFALIILAVGVLLSGFKVKNAIDSEIANMSVLKALGYTSARIIAGIALPYGIVSLFFALLGLGLSYALLPALCSALAVQSGFSFAVSFDLMSFVCIASVLCGAVVFFAYISARKIKKTQAIDGLRGSNGPEHTRRNYFPLEESRGSIKTLLVLKQMLASAKQNVMLFLVSFVLTVLVAFSGTLFYNAVIEPDNFMSALSDEAADVIIYPESDSLSELESELDKDSRVQNSLKYISAAVIIEGKTVIVFACEDFSKVRNDVCYMGENPEKADEIALGSAFEENYKIGDTVIVTLDDITKSFRVTGFVQSVNLQGEFCELSIEGYNSISVQTQPPSLYVYLENPENAEEITEEYRSDRSELAADAINARKLQKQAQDMYMGISIVLVAAIFAVTVCVVLFILYIVVRTLLVKRRRELGIYKALGYTSAQLILQTLGSFVPVSIIAVVLSGVLALFYMPPVYRFIFEALGVMKNNIEISFGFLMLFAAAQILANLVISIILCMPIRKISAYALIRE